MSEHRFPKPTWARGVMEKYSSGVAHAFILCFNVHDYAVPGAPFTTYLAQMLAGRQVVAVYSRDRGITFPWRRCGSASSRSWDWAMVNSRRPTRPWPPSSPWV